ncbi:CHAD domain-containing protein, partial [Roseateles sp.]|uniref:CHAD domain-containing protein n=1 Tax=Roseateles sp. TaxID=1971397 RepID=UPI002E0B20B7|nr:CHAD domain-containing protein [Roseateles sp.]
SPQSQRLLLAWLSWRAGLQAREDAPAGLKHAARHRLRRWHQALAAAWRGFDALDAAALHALRKHVKRQRYAVEFFAPLLPRKRTARYLTALAAAQQALGEVNDLAVARARYEGRVADDPAAWFAVGWLAARQPPLRDKARHALGELAALPAPGR